MIRENIRKPCSVLMILLFIAPAFCQEEQASPVFKQEELEQILAPIAIYPDSLLSQVLMASTYPLEIVQAHRWYAKNSSLTGTALATELEKQTWDPSVRSLVNFPQVLTMMSEKLDWTQKLGDAFLAQQKDVMDTVQTLREKAQAAGKLESTEDQVVTVEQDTIVIEYANPQVVYVPTYDPVVVYGGWPYPSYPPYYYYPPGYVYPAPWVTFSAGVAWGYAWGHCDWDDCDIDIDVDRNWDFNGKIDRDAYVEHYKNSGRFEDRKGQWQHNPENRKGVAYRDQATAKRFNRASTSDAVRSREEFRGRAEQGRSQLSAGTADSLRNTQSGQVANRAATRDISSSVSNRADNLGSVNRGLSDTSGTRPQTGQTRNLPTANRPSVSTYQSPSYSANRSPSYSNYSSRANAFDGMGGGSSARNYSSRGSMSRQSMSRPSGGSFGGSRGGSMGGSRGGARGGGGRR